MHLPWFFPELIALRKSNTFLKLSLWIRYVTLWIQIVESFASRKFMSKASLIHVSIDLKQAAKKWFFNFIWKLKDRIKRVALINDIEYGGPRRVKDAWLTRIYDSSTKNHELEEVYWRLFKSLLDKNFLSYYLAKVEGKFSFRCHSDCIPGFC